MNTIPTFKSTCSPFLLAHLLCHAPPSERNGDGIIPSFTIPNTNMRTLIPSRFICEDNAFNIFRHMNQSPQIRRMWPKLTVAFVGLELKSDGTKSNLASVLTGEDHAEYNAVPLTIQHIREVTLASSCLSGFHLSDEIIDVHDALRRILGHLNTMWQEKSGDKSAQMDFFENLCNQLCIACLPIDGLHRLTFYDHVMHAIYPSKSTNDDMTATMDSLWVQCQGDIVEVDVFVPSDLREEPTIKAMRERSSELQSVTDKSHPLNYMDLMSALLHRQANDVFIMNNYREHTECSKNNVAWSKCFEDARKTAVLAKEKSDPFSGLAIEYFGEKKKHKNWFTCPDEEKYKNLTDPYRPLAAGRAFLYHCIMGKDKPPLEKYRSEKSPDQFLFCYSGKNVLVSHVAYFLLSFLYTLDSDMRDLTNKFLGNQWLNKKRRVEKPTETTSAVQALLLLVFLVCEHAYFATAIFKELIKYHSGLKNLSPNFREVLIIKYSATKAMHYLMEFGSMHPMPNDSDEESIFKQVAEQYQVPYERPFVKWLAAKRYQSEKIYDYDRNSKVTQRLEFPPGGNHPSFEDLFQDALSRLDLTQVEFFSLADDEKKPDPFFEKLSEITFLYSQKALSDCELNVQTRSLSPFKELLPRQKRDTNDGNLTHFDDESPSLTTIRLLEATDHNELLAIEDDKQKEADGDNLKNNEDGSNDDENGDNENGDDGNDDDDDSDDDESGDDDGEEGGNNSGGSKAKSGKPPAPNASSNSSADPKSSKSKKKSKKSNSSDANNNQLTNLKNTQDSQNANSSDESITSQQSKTNSDPPPNPNPPKPKPKPPKSFKKNQLLSLDTVINSSELQTALEAIQNIEAPKRRKRKRNSPDQPLYDLGKQKNLTNKAKRLAKKILSDLNSLQMEAKKANRCIIHDCNQKTNTDTTTIFCPTHFTSKKYRPRSPDLDVSLFLKDVNIDDPKCDYPDCGCAARSDEPKLCDSCFSMSYAHTSCCSQWKHDNNCDEKGHFCFSCVSQLWNRFHCDKCKEKHNTNKGVMGVCVLCKKLVCLESDDPHGRNLNDYASTNTLPDNDPLYHCDNQTMKTLSSRRDAMKNPDDYLARFCMCKDCESLNHTPDPGF